MAMLRIRIPILYFPNSSYEYTFIGIIEEITTTEVVIVCVI